MLRRSFQNWSRRRGGMDSAQNQHVLGTGRAPEHARLFAARADHGLAAGLDDTGPDEQALPTKGPILHSFDM